MPGQLQYRLSIQKWIWFHNQNSRNHFTVTLAQTAEMDYYVLPLAIEKIMYSFFFN